MVCGKHATICVRKRNDKNISLCSWCLQKEKLGGYINLQSRYQKVWGPGGLVQRESKISEHPAPLFFSALNLGQCEWFWTIKCYLWYSIFPGGATGKESTCQCRRSKRHGFDSWSWRSPGEGNGNPLQYSSLGNPMDKGAWQATIHGVAKSRTVSN